MSFFEFVDEDFCSSLDRNELNQLVDEHLLNGDYESAVFWAEKIVSLAPGKSIKYKLPEIANYMATLTAAGQWQMIITFISRHDLFLIHLIFAYFYINALFNRKMYTEIVTLPLSYLGQWEDVPFITPDTSSKIFSATNQIQDERICKSLDGIVVKRKYESRLLFVLAKTYLMVQNRPAAAGCVRHCLHANIFSSEAIYLALDSRLLSISEIQTIITPGATTNPSGYNVLKLILDIYNINNLSDKVPNINSSDLSIRAAYAFRLYHKGEVLEAHKITSQIIHNFGYYNKCFLVHVGCLVELNQVSELYALGHALVRIQPEKEITWYTVGCYYFATGQYSTAKKFLNKCTQLNNGFGEGWLAYGHALFYAEEHEQAMNCYLRSSRILEGHFEPLLYIAVEYCFANNFKFANDFLHDAREISGINPVVLHEQATTAYMNEEYTKAEHLYLCALNLITTKNSLDVEIPPLETMLSYSVSDFWEPIYNNLGHTLRLLEKYESAIEVHRKSLLFSKHKIEPWSSIGLCYASMGKLNLAMEALNKALSLKPSDDNVKSALEKILDRAAKLPVFLTIVDETEENIDILIEQAKNKNIKSNKKQSFGSINNSSSKMVK